jgi:hypothetical protein
VGFVVDKAALGQVFSSTSVSPATHSTDCSALTIVHHPGLVQEASSGPSNSGLGSTSPQEGKKSPNLEIFWSEQKK